MPFTLSVAARAPAGTTGIAVRRSARVGTSSRWMLTSTSAIASTALAPKNGMLPCAVRPTVVTSHQ